MSPANIFRGVRGTGSIRQAKPAAHTIENGEIETLNTAEGSQRIGDEVSPRTFNPLAELVDYLRTHEGVCRSKRWLGSLFHVGVTLEIAADVAKNEREAAQKAYAAEQLTIEAERAIDCGDLATARRLLKKAEFADHDASELLAS